MRGPVVRCRHLMTMVVVVDFVWTNILLLGSTWGDGSDWIW